MIQKHSTAPVIDKVRPTTREVVALRFEAILLGAAAAGIVVGASWLALEYQEPRVLLAAGASVVLGVRSWLLWSEVATGPSLARRVWRRYVAWRMVRAMQPQPVKPPYRVVNEGRANEFYMPHQPGEMRSARERTIVAGYTASDVFEVVRDAAIYGLHERALKKNGERAWKFGPQERRVLPSGKQLSRDGFREVQRYLVAQGWATADPSYRLIVTPEEIGRELEKIGG